MTTRLMRAREPFVVEVDGVAEVYNPDRIVRSTDRVVRDHPERFVPADMIEEATATPGERRHG